jgi:hypothetical protein
MFNNAIDCDLSDWTINEKKEIPADLLIPKIEGHNLYLRRIDGRITIPMALYQSAFPFTYTSISLKIATTGQFQTYLIKFATDYKLSNLEAFKRVKHECLGEHVLSRAVEVGKTDPTQ